MIVNQWLAAAHKGDAIGDSARKTRQLLRGLGHESELFALTIDEGLEGLVRPFSDPAARRGDVTVLHYALPSPMTAARFPNSIEPESLRLREKRPCLLG